MQHTFSLMDWSAWSPNLDSKSAWLEWSEGRFAEQNFDKPEVKDIPMLIRRRLSRLGRMALRVALDVGGSDDAHLVFCSRFGDTEGVAKMMQQLVDGKNLSPSEFSMSVHNAFAGALSILQKNTRSHSAISAGQDSFCAGFLESVMLLKENPGAEILYVFYEEPMFELIPDAASHRLDLALAIRLTGDTDVGSKMSFSVELSDENLRCSEEAVELGFIRFLCSANCEWSWRGENATWHFNKL